MTLDELKNLCARITYKGKPCVEAKDKDWRNGRDVELSGKKYVISSQVPEGYIYIGMWIEAICVIEGTPTKIENGNLWSLKEVSEITEFRFLKVVKEMIISLEAHEVEELMAVDGVRIFDPHKDQELPKVNLETEIKQAA